jgi:hypothetical protein
VAKLRHRPVVETDPDVDVRIQEISDELLRMSRKLPMRLTGDGYFLESVALVLKREHQLVNSLKCAVRHYDELFDTVFASVDRILKPPPQVIDVPFEPEVVRTGPAET